MSESGSANSYQNDRIILRDLARKVAELASLPVQAERAKLIFDLNGLRPARPVVLAFPEGGWRDLLAESELLCADPLLRQWELRLRHRIRHAEIINDDQPLTDSFDIGTIVDVGDCGMKEVVHRTEDIGSFHWDPPLTSTDDLSKLHMPTMEIKYASSARRFQLASDIFGDILRIRNRAGRFWTVGLTKRAIMLRGLEQFMLDMYDNTQFLHNLMAFLRDAQAYELDFYEKNGLLTLNNSPDSYVGSGGLGYTDQLPADDYQGAVRTKDMWALSESQETVGVGPEQYEEFVLQYQLPVINRFGLVCYGCCEPMDKRLDLVMKHIPHLRRVSISPWANRSLAAEKLGNRYVFSWKPNPATICGPTVDWAAVRADIRKTLDVTEGCCLEMIMKDTHTFNGDPTRVGRWVKMAMELATDANQ